MRIDSRDITPPFDRTKSLATAAHAAKLLQLFTQARCLYPGDVDNEEARELHELLCKLLEGALQHEVWRDQDAFADVTVEWTPIPFEPPGLPSWLAPIPGVAVLLLAQPLNFHVDSEDPTSFDRAFEAIAPYRAPTLEPLADRIVEIMTFDMEVPHPAGDPEYSTPARSLFLFGNYWDAYRTLLDQFGAAHIHRQPNPMFRFIVSLQRRLRLHAARIDDGPLRYALERVVDIDLDADASLLWGDWAQPRINRLSEAFEQLRAECGSRQFELTHEEALFLGACELALVEVTKDAERLTTALLRPPEPSAAVDSSMVSVSLSEAAIRQARSQGFKGFVSLELTGRSSGNRNSLVVKVAGDERAVPVSHHTFLIRLVRALQETDAGWVALGRGGLSDEEWFPARQDQFIARQRESFKNLKLPDWDKPSQFAIIETARGKVRLSVPRGLVSWDERSLQHQLDHYGLSELAKLLAVTAVRN